MILNFIDNQLNNITMYRLVLYYLIFLVSVALLFCLFGILPYNPIALLLSLAILVGISWLTNRLFAKAFSSITNIESVYISALILALIITPVRSTDDLGFFIWAAVWTMASKFIFAINRKHLFNPVAFSLVLLSLTINHSASWWVGSAPMMVFVLLGGLLIVRKIKRFDLVFSFFVMALLTITVGAIVRGSDLLSILKETLMSSPLLFFAFVMLTEPLTTPPTKLLQMVYGGLIGILFAPQLHFGSIYLTPEMALLSGNIFSYIVSPKQKLILKLAQKIQLAPDIADFIFESSQKMDFKPGQYLEWTMDGEDADSRGNRRYFTVASSPTEKNIHLGVKFYQNSSSFKKKLQEMAVGGQILAGQLAGEFNLPRDPGQKIVFITGGIGITPFRSMIQYLLDTNQPRNIVLMYSNKLAADIVYRDVFEQAQQKLGIKLVYTLSDLNSLPSNWTGETGMIDAKMIEKEIPDYRERIFYLSGPRGMVVAFEKTLKDMGVDNSHIKIDFFPGFV